jgi:uncharacterized protein YcbX
MAAEGLERAALQGDLSLPTRWREAGTVTKLLLYPVKSLAAQRVGRAEARPAGAVSGPLVDRGMMVLDRRGRMVTGRKHPAMWLASVRQESEDWMVLSYPGMPDLGVALGAGEQVLGEVWGEACSGRDLGPAAGRWLSEAILGEEEAGLRRVQHAPGPSSRPDKLTDKLIAPLERPEDKPLFADGYPFLLLSAASVADLNRRLEEEGAGPVAEDRFRPNIFIEGDFPAFAEDGWSHVKIGGAVFRNVKLCTRCVFVTVGPS